MKLIPLLAGALCALAAALAAAEIPPYLPAPHDFKRIETVKPAEVEFRLGNETVRPSDFVRSRSLNGEWRFSGVTNSAAPFPADTDLSSGFMQPEFDASGWSTIRVPLDWFMKYPQARKESEPYTKGLYRTAFQLTSGELRDRRVILKFDCVGYEAKVFLNGKEVGNHHGDFTPFEIDATDAAKAGENVLALRVFSDFGPAFGRKEKAVHAYGAQWWIGNIKGGIWQDVTLSLEPALRISKMFVVPDLAKGGVEVDYTIVNHTGKPFAGTLDGVVTDAMKAAANTPAGAASARIALKPGVNTGRLVLKLENPQKWSVDRPYLYFLTLALREPERVVSAASSRFGYREFHTKDGKFYLNGEEIYLFGENIPSCSYGGFGRSAADEEKRLSGFILGCRNLGYVILRNAHMPIVPAALAIADECGMMVFNEWAWCFTAGFDIPEFEKRNLPELREFVEATYNHPSVVMWSLGNEVVHSNRPEIARQMDLQVAAVRAMDRQKRPISTFSGQAGWQSYGRTKLDTDVYDLHTYVALSSPWTRRNLEADRVYRGLLEIFGGAGGRLDKPLVAWENVGFSWGFHDASNKNPEFKRGDIDEYLKYAGRKFNWGQPCGIGFTGCMSLAEAVDPAVRQDVPMSRYGRRIFELYRLDRRFTGFAPWFSDPTLRAAALWNQPVLPTLRNRAGLPPRSLFAGETTGWTMELVNSSNRAYRGLTLALSLAGSDGKTVPVASLPAGELPPQCNVAREIKFAMPVAATGFYQLRLTLLENGREIARNYYDLYLDTPALRSGKIEPVRPVFVYDTGSPENVARLGEQLKAFGIPFRIIRRFGELKAPATLIVPAEGAGTPQRLRLKTEPELSRFMNEGGILLLLEQRNPASELPGGLLLVADEKSFCDPAVSAHPVFAGLSDRNFDTWNNPDCGYVVSASCMPLNANALAVKGPDLGRRDIGMALLEGRVGRGRLIASQLEAFASAPQDSSAMRYLYNLIRYAVGTETLRGETRPLIPAAAAEYKVTASRLVPVNLGPYANRSFTDEADNDGKGGWFDQGENDFRMMPLGTVEAAGVTFEIIDPARNGGRSCIVLAGTDRPKFPLAVTGIRVNRRFSRLFFLHTAAWGGETDAGRYRMNYADGKSVELPLAGNRNIGDWWNASPLPEALVGIHRRNAAGYNVGTFIAEWENPRPEVEIASIDFLSPLCRDRGRIDYLPAKTAVPCLIAVTGETVPGNPFEITGKNLRGCNPAREVGSTVSGTVRKSRAEGAELWNIAFKASPEGEIPAAFFVYSPEGMSGRYDSLVLNIRSRREGRVEVVLPEKNWRGRFSGSIDLAGDGKFHTYRLRFGRELKQSGSFSLAGLRNELFFFYRGSRARPALEFTVRSAVLE
ncbi:MAG: glycoside hydrolase family 2 [Lentisphaeria bacterium]|nr:glycoside hydrolase family 2 [Lentisphaeria bacterium]